MFWIDFDIKKLFKRLFGNKLWIVLSLLAALGLAKLYILYAIPEYKVQCSILLRDQSINEEIVNQAIPTTANLYNTSKDILQQIRLLKSPALMREVVEQLHLNTSYYEEGQFVKSSLYKEAPVVVDTAVVDEQGYGVDIAIKIIDSLTYEVVGADSLGIIRFESWATLPFARFRLQHRSPAPRGQVIFVRFEQVDLVATRLVSKLNIKPEAATNILEASLNSPIPTQAVDILNLLVEVYNRHYLEERNRKNANTLAFLENRVEKLSQELSAVERSTLDFKIENELSSERALKIEALLSKLDDRRKALSELLLNEEILQSLKGYITSERTDTTYYAFLPTSIEVKAEESRLRSMLKAYNERLLRRERLFYSAKPDNPSVQAFNEELDLLKLEILSIIDKELKDLQSVFADYKMELSELEERITTLPSLEGSYTDLNRQREIMERLYLSLLQRKEEIAMAMAVTPGNSKILEPPKNMGLIAPKTFMVYLVAVFAGLAFPIMAIAAQAIRDTTIEDEEDVEKQTDLPLAGSITEVKGKSKIVVAEGMRSGSAEMFRLLRTNLHYLTQGRTNLSLMATSNMSREGKSFIVANLGIAFALSGKRVLLIGLDLRKPKLFQYLNGHQEPGIVNYMLDPIPASELVQEYEGHPNVHFISSGSPLPPNPAELILQERLQELLSQMREQYDCIIIDTPPVGVVTDGFLINEQVDMSLIVLRSGKTTKAQVRALQKLHTAQRLIQPVLILNGIKTSKRNGYGYYE